MSKPEYTIGVTGLNAIDSPGPGLGVVRALHDAESFNAKVIGLSYEALEPGIYMKDLVPKTYQIPYPLAGKETLFDRLAYINSIDDLDFIFPNFDAEIPNFISMSKRFDEELGIKTFLPSQEQFEARNKVNLFEYGEKHKINVPKSKVVHSSNELMKLEDAFKFPLVIKGKYYDAKIAYTLDQAVQHFNKISAQWGLPILAQEHISGSESNVCGVANGKGETIGAVPMRKLYITDKGKAWAGVTLDNDKLIDATHDFVKKTNWKGAFELEFMRTPKDEYFLIEINPRFPAWSYLTVGSNQNQVEAVVNMSMGKNVKPFASYEVGKMFIRYSYDMIVNMSDFDKISIKGEL